MYSSATVSKSLNWLKFTAVVAAYLGEKSGMNEIILSIRVYT